MVLENAMGHVCVTGVCTLHRPEDRCYLKIERGCETNYDWEEFPTLPDMLAALEYRAKHSAYRFSVRCSSNIVPRHFIATRLIKWKALRSRTAEGRIWRWKYIAPSAKARI